MADLDADLDAAASEARSEALLVRRCVMSAQATFRPHVHSQLVTDPRAGKAYLVIGRRALDAAQGTPLECLACDAKADGKVRQPLGRTDVELVVAACGGPACQARIGSWMDACGHEAGDAAPCAGARG